jgi:hypothetical protein
MEIIYRRPLQRRAITKIALAQTLLAEMNQFVKKRERAFVRGKTAK